MVGKDFEGDEIKDAALLKEGIEKRKDYAEAARWISAHLMKKYGSEFGGNMTFEYDRVANNFLLTYGKSKRVFEEDELGTLPMEIKLLRKAAAAGKQ